MTVLVQVKDKEEREILDWSRKIPIFDALNYVNKPDLGLSKDLHLIREWEATIQHDPGNPPSAETIEEPQYSDLIAAHNNFKYLCIDIESLDHPAQDNIGIDYVTRAKIAAPNSLVTWWNLGPTNVVNVPEVGAAFDLTAWQAEFDARQPFVDACDFCVLGCYFLSGYTLETWREKHILRIAEARRLFKDKPVVITLSPHLFDQGNPWPFVTGQLFGDVLRIVHEQNVDGILLWSFEGTGQLQTWDPTWDWLTALDEYLP